MQYKKQTHVHTCSNCDQSFYSKYAFKTHSCEHVTGFTSRDDAIAAIRKERRM